MLLSSKGVKTIDSNITLGPVRSVQSMAIAIEQLIVMEEGKVNQDV